ncbi:hypothetical protein LA10_00260 [Thermotoga neapolitana LA10]|nr:hypothetical protein LA10_00260 [Thermotoga neapolitana LA10]
MVYFQNAGGLFPYLKGSIETCCNRIFPQKETFWFPYLKGSIETKRDFPQPLSKPEVSIPLRKD